MSAVPSPAKTAAATVSGGNILSMLAAMGPFRRRGEQLLAECGISKVAVNGWYSLPAYVSALEAIERTFGPNTLFMVGKQIPNHIQLPPGLDNFEAVFGSFGPAFDLNHRGVGPAGGIVCTLAGDRTGTIVSGTPYPCDFDRGVIQGFFNTLLSTRVELVHDASTCKSRGDAKCLHRVTCGA
jgi:hypothetical protein